MVAFSSIGCGYGAEARLWIARRQAEDTLADLELGPIFSTEHAAAGRLRMWGEFASMGYGNTSLDERGRLLIVRTSDGAMRQIRAPKPYAFAFSTVTDRYAYAVPTGNLMRFEEIYRYDLEWSDLLGEPLVPVPDAAAPGPR